MRCYAEAVVIWGYISAAGVGFASVFSFGITSEFLAAIWFVAGRVALWAPQLSDLVVRADRMTLGSPSAKGEWQSGALGGALIEELVIG